MVLNSIQNDDIYDGSRREGKVGIFCANEELAYAISEEYWGQVGYALLCKGKRVMLLSEMEAQANSFLTMAFEELERRRFILEEHWHIDHLCYRTSSQESYLSAKTDFGKFGKLLIESEVNGRMISTFKLASPISFKDWKIDLIEVPAPKAGKITIDGFEHFEIVCDLPFAEIKDRYSQVQFEESGLTKDVNQELEVSLAQFALKFHHLSLESVINVEANQKVFSALKKSGILKLLKPYNPLVAGTFPLNISRDDSDLDILVSANDLNLIKNSLTEKLGSWLNFQCREMLIEGEPTLLVSFSFQGVDFEIFGQKVPAIRQRGYLHFLAEERLLKLGGDLFAHRIKEARAQGLKTEPAFAKVLGLSGDPFRELLRLQKLSNIDLRGLIG